MEWVETGGGTALQDNGKVVGWVTTTMGGRFLNGLVGQPTKTKASSATKDEAKAKLLAQVEDVGEPA